MNFSPYMRVLNSLKEPLLLRVAKINYVYTEKISDNSTVELITDDPSYVDNEFIQEDKAIFLEWGYREIPESISVRKIYIVESTADFNENGLTIVIKGKSRAHYLKYNSINNVRVDTTLSKVAKELSDIVGIELTDELSGDQEYDVHSTGYAKPGQITQKGYEVPVDSARVRRDYLYK